MMHLKATNADGPLEGPSAFGVRTPSLLDLLFRQLDQGFLIRELASFELGIDQLVVIFHLEAASPARGEDEVLDVLLERREQLGRQTDGLGLVVSHRAVGDVDFHRRSSSGLRLQSLLLLS